MKYPRIVTSISEVTSDNGTYPAVESISNNLAPYVKEGIRLLNDTGTEFTIWKDDDGLSELYFTVYIRTPPMSSGTYGSPSNFIDFNKDGETLFQVVAYGNLSTDAHDNAFRWRTTSGESTNLYTNLLSGSGLYRWDFHIKLHPVDGAIRIFQNNTMVYEFTGNTEYQSHFSHIDEITIKRRRGSSDFYTCLSAMIISDKPTNGIQVFQRAPIAYGDRTDWFGSLNSIKDVGYTDTTYIQGVNDGDTSTFHMQTTTGVPRYNKIREIVHTVNTANVTLAAAGVKTFVQYGDERYESEVENPPYQTFQNYQYHIDIPDELKDFTKLNNTQMGLVTNKNDEG